MDRKIAHARGFRRICGGWVDGGMGMVGGTKPDAAKNNRNACKNGHFWPSARRISGLRNRLPGPTASLDGDLHHLRLANTSPITNLQARAC